MNCFSVVFLSHILYFVYFIENRCDSFGNRHVEVTNNRNRKNSFGTGRVRSGSTGNRPVKAYNHARPLRQQTTGSASGVTNSSGASQTNRVASQVITRQPPHHEQSQQHNFAAPRKGIFGHISSNAAAAAAAAAAPPSTNTLANSKENNKENLSSKRDTGDAKLNATATASTAPATAGKAKN